MKYRSQLFSFAIIGFALKLLIIVLIILKDLIKPPNLLKIRYYFYVNIRIWFLE
jgi:hypothetical protein